MIAQPIPSARLFVEELRARGDVRALRGDFERLAARMRDAGQTRGPFLSPDWLSIFAAALAGDHADDRVGDLTLLTAHQDGRLVAALPLIAEKRKMAGLPVRLLRSLSDDHSQRFDLLLDPDVAAPAAEALVAHLSRKKGWDALELQVVPDEHAAADALFSAARAAGLPVGAWGSLVSPYLRLPARAEGLAGCLDAKFRSNLRRRARKLEAEVGPIALERVDGAGVTGAELDAALDEGFALEAAGWKGEAGTAIARSPALVARYRALAHAFAQRGGLACYFLRAGGRRVAFHFALIEGDTYYLLKPGFDPALSTFGLGHLLIERVVGDLIARDVRDLDFLGDDMPWKREWTKDARAHSFRYLFAPTIRGRALAAWKLSVIPLAHRALGH